MSETEMEKVAVKLFNNKDKNRNENRELYSYVTSLENMYDKIIEFILNQHFLTLMTLKVKQSISSRDISDIGLEKLISKSSNVPDIYEEWFY